MVAKAAETAANAGKEVLKTGGNILTGAAKQVFHPTHWARNAGICLGIVFAGAVATQMASGATLWAATKTTVAAGAHHVIDAGGVLKDQIMAADWASLTTPKLA